MSMIVAFVCSIAYFEWLNLLSYYTIYQLENIVIRYDVLPSLLVENAFKQANSWLACQCIGDA